MTFKIQGIALIRADTANLSPWFLLINLSGFKTLNSLRDLQLLRSSLYSTEHMIERVTIVKSIKFQPSLKNDCFPLKIRPSAIIFTNISAEKIIVNIISEYITNLFTFPYGSLRGLSRVKRILCIMIKQRITCSKYLDLTIFKSQRRNQLVPLNRNREQPKEISSV